ISGHSVGHWEGDTLVIESVGFEPTTWLARGGFFHSGNMRVIERFTRKGDQMLYEVIVEDPEVLLQPWRQKPLMMTFISKSGGLLGVERGHCENYEEGDIVTQLRH